MESVFAYCWVTFFCVASQPFPPRIEERVKESKRRAAFRKIGGRALLLTKEIVVFNPSAFTLGLLSGSRWYCECGSVSSLSLGVRTSEKSVRGDLHYRTLLYGRLKGPVMRFRHRGEA
ncbi:hypothetical protein IQ06DRAFT_296269 [Phaeosphaeriaceae sp. SRC1lsM3a]|nr:hypothetical protein IQ06DRAFT_296269 [Stagonospora sp. SRC1lsM3a]